MSPPTTRHAAITRPLRHPRATSHEREEAFEPKALREGNEAGHEGLQPASAAEEEVTPERVPLHAKFRFGDVFPAHDSLSLVRRSDGQSSNETVVATERSTIRGRSRPLSAGFCNGADPTTIAEPAVRRAFRRARTRQPSLGRGLL